MCHIFKLTYLEFAVFERGLSEKGRKLLQSHIHALVYIYDTNFYLNVTANDNLIATCDTISFDTNNPLLKVQKSKAIS